CSPTPSKNRVAASSPWHPHGRPHPSSEPNSNPTPPPSTHGCSRRARHCRPGTSSSSTKPEWPAPERSAKWHAAPRKPVLTFGSSVTTGNCQPLNPAAHYASSTRSPAVPNSKMSSGSTTTTNAKPHSFSATETKPKATSSSGTSTRNAPTTPTQTMPSPNPTPHGRTTPSTTITATCSPGT